jgi:hypothetical protein
MRQSCASAYLPDRHQRLRAHTLFSQRYDVGQPPRLPTVFHKQQSRRFELVKRPEIKIFLKLFCRNLERREMNGQK